jgi:soluble lytic murein transglycosylase-like protein
MRKGWWIAVPAAAFVLALPAGAGERVTLRNGFEMRCDHHAETEGRVRLFLSAGEDNYIEVEPAEITGVERAADPPPAEAFAVPAGKSAEKPGLGKKSAEVQLSAADLGEMLGRAGHEHNLDVDLLASLVKAESGGNARARSRAGAEGLMQLMPATAADLGVKDRLEPEQNVQGGSTYLDTLLARYHENLALALAAYNAGPAAVDKYRGIPPYAETRAYVARVIHEFNRRVLKREAEARRLAAERAATR